MKSETTTHTSSPHKRQTAAESIFFLYLFGNPAAWDESPKRDKSTVIKEFFTRIRLLFHLPPELGSPAKISDASTAAAELER